MPEKNQKIKLGLKNLSMLPSYSSYILVHVRQKVHLMPGLSPKFLLTLGPIPARTQKPEKLARFTTLYRSTDCTVFLNQSADQTD